MLPFYEFVKNIEILNTSYVKLREKSNDYSLRSVLKTRYHKSKLVRRIKKTKRKIKKIFTHPKKKLDSLLYSSSPDILGQYKNDLKCFKRKKNRRKVLFDELFTNYENYGTILDLRFVKEYHVLNYCETLQNIYDLNFKQLLDQKNVTEKDKEKRNILLLLHIQTYLINFLIKAHPRYKEKFFLNFLGRENIQKHELFQGTTTYNQRGLLEEHKNVHETRDCVKKTARQFQKYKWMYFIQPNIVFPPVQEYADLIFCSSCKSVFSLNIWQYHIAGRKHKSKISVISRKDVNSSTEKKIYPQELHHTKILCNKNSFLSILPQMLLPTQEELIKNIKTILVLLEDEHKTSISLVTSEISGEGPTRPRKPTTSNNILYRKSQKLFCEICNEIFDRRREFDEHFSTDKHVSGLNLMKIKDYEKFIGLSRIENIKKMKKRFESKETCPKDKN